MISNDFRRGLTDNYTAIRLSRRQAAMMNRLTNASSTRIDILLLYLPRAACAALATASPSSFCRPICPRSASAPAQIGIVASASLLGTALLTLAVGFIAPRHDLRNLLLGGAVLMASHRSRLSQFRSDRFHRDRGVRRHRSIHRPATSAYWCRSSTPCWRTARPTRSARAPSPATA